MRQAVSQLLRARVFTLTACVSLALAVGANSAIFTIVNALWFRPVPIRAPERIVVPYYPVVHGSDGEVLDDVRYGNAQYLHELSSFESVTYELNTAARIGDWRPIIRLRPSLDQLESKAVAANYFDVLGVPVRGRTFRAEDDLVGAAPVAIVSERLCRRLGPESGVMGMTLETTRGSVTVVGIAGNGFRGPRLGDQVDLWIPLGVLGVFSEMGFDPNLTALTPVVVFARLRPEVSVSAAEAEIRTMLDSRTTLRTLRDVAFPLRAEGELIRQRDLLRMLWLAAALVLVLGAANLAALFAARISQQRHQWAVRLSVGETRSGIVRIVLLEIGVLTCGGILLGLIVRYWLLKSIVIFEPAAAVSVADLDLSLDLRVLAFAAALAVVSAVVASTGVVRQASRTDVSILLSSGASNGSHPRARARQILLGAHVALTVPLLIAAIALVARVRESTPANPGFARNELIFATVRPAITQYMREHDDMRRRTRDYAAATERLGSLPEVLSATYGERPLAKRRQLDGPVSLTVDGVRRQIVMAQLSVGPRYLQTAGATLLAGRDFTRDDVESAVMRHEMMRYVMMRRVGREMGPPPNGGRSTAIIDSSLASALWPDVSAIGRTFIWNSLQIRYEVIGVVRDIRRRVGGQRPTPTLLVPVSLRSFDGTQAYDLIVRTRGEPRRAVAPVAGVLRELFPDAPVLEVNTASHALRSELAQERMGARVFSWYAAAAGVLGLVGVHGLLAFLLSQTRQELAIRAALGASAPVLARTTVVGVVAPVVAGVLAGLLVSTWLRRILGTGVIGFGEVDVVAEAAAAGLILAGCAVMAFAGSRKVASISPAELLRMP